MSTRRRTALALVLMAMLIGACIPGLGSRHEMTFPGAADGPPALPVVLDDRTGLVTRIDQPPVAGDIFFPDGVSNLPGRHDMLAVTWMTGACTVRTEMLLEPGASGYRLSVAVIDRPGACILIGYGRTMAITLAAPVDAGTVEFVLVD